MGKVLALSEETYHQLVDLAQRQQRTVEEMLQLCLAAYEEALYERTHQQMLAEGVLVSLPAPPLLPGETEEGDDFEPVELPGTPLSEIILEDRRSCPPSHRHVYAHARRPSPAPQGGATMGKVLEVSEETYQQFTALAEQQHRTPDEMLRLCVLAYEQYQYHLVHQDMVAEGLLEAIPLLLPLDAEDDDFEPEVIPGKPLSEIILEDRR